MYTNFNSHPWYHILGITSLVSSPNISLKEEEKTLTVSYNIDFVNLNLIEVHKSEDF